MDKKKLMQNYADILVHIGVNLQKGQGLHVTVPVEGAELARAVSKSAYDAGASSVIVRFTDEVLEQYNGAFADQDQLFENYVEKEYAALTGLSEKEFAFLRLYAPDFSEEAADSGDRQEKWAVRTDAISRQLRNHTMDHGWTCIGTCPTVRWARHVFPELPEDEALDKLWEMLFHITRADSDDPVGGWTRHSDGIVARGIQMTDLAFDELHIVGPGTDLHVGLIPSHIWGGGRFTNNHGVPAVPNIPTEELASTPDRTKTRGVVSSVRPLVFQGEIIDGFHIRFENGKAVEWSAEKGQEALTRLITHDEGSCYLGEVAVVPSDGLIGSTNVVYYCTLLDENATCHLALGAGFTMHVRDSRYNNLVNTSSVHEDFMIGNTYLRIFGVKDGVETPVFQYGKWVI